ncbi:chromate transporter [Novosphingobium terrae]|uniref:chromate transporter n=1 Tax=Novosphingobium terrae TaxID=2726189 RepID=UPI00197E73C6|nr:chromate transporter [Novosphingobium terrae]
MDTRPSLQTLFFSFLKIGLMGFGGVAAIARHVLVVERRWVNDEEYGRLLGLCQALPGANTVNAAVMLGDRYRGPLGALICVIGIMAAPLTILVAAATAYDRVANHPLAQLALTGAAVSAAGLILGTSAKLLVRARPSPMAWACAIAALVAVAGFHKGLLPTLACLAPLSLASAAWSTRRASS